MPPAKNAVRAKRSLVDNPYLWELDDPGPRRDAQLYVLSILGKCTDGFVDVEKKLLPVLYEKPTYGRDTKSALAKVKAGFIPYSERN